MGFTSVVEIVAVRTSPKQYKATEVNIIAARDFPPETRNQNHPRRKGLVNHAPRSET